MEDWRVSQPGPTALPGVPDAPPRLEPLPGVTVAGPGASHRPWSTLLLVLHALGVAAGVAVVAYGVVIVVAAYNPPPRPADEIYEPWGIFIGAFLAVVGIGVIVAAAVLTALTVRARRAADQGRPGVLRGLAITAVVLAGTGAVASIFFVFPVGLVLSCVYAVTGVLVLRSTRVTTRV